MKEKNYKGAVTIHLKRILSRIDIAFLLSPFFLIGIVFLFSGCAPAITNSYQSSLGILATETSETISVAPSDLAHNSQDTSDASEPTARAALQRDLSEVKAEKEKQEKIVAPLDNKPGSGATKSDSPESFTSKAFKETIRPEQLQQQPRELTQLYFDEFSKSEQSADSYPGTNSQMNNAKFSNFDKKRSANGVVYANTDKSRRLNNSTGFLTKDQISRIVIPGVLILISMIVVLAAIGYRREVNRIKAAHRNELAKQKLWGVR